MAQSNHGGMMELVLTLPEQLLAGYETALQCGLKVGKRPPACLVALGMGGSAISGGLLAGLVAETVSTPILTCRDYALPALVTAGTFVIAVSYSGNTEETLSAFAAAQARGCPIAVITSGGRLLSEARRLKLPAAIVPTGLPPRAALGFIFGALLAVVGKIGIDVPTRTAIVAAARLMKKRGSAWKRKARLLSAKLNKCLPIIYATDRLTDPVAERWRCQLNENAKVLCHSSVLPEHNHNEIVGMGAPPSVVDSHIIALVSSSTHSRTELRLKHLISITRGAIKGATVIKAEGDSRLEQLMSLVMLGDFLSCELAQRLGVDPLPVERIDELKRRMARG